MSFKSIVLLSLAGLLLQSFGYAEPESNPSSQNELFQRAVSRLKSGELDTAMADFNELLVLNKTNDLFYQWRGGVHLAKGEVDKGIEDLTRAIEINSQNDAAYLNRAQACRMAGQFDKAIEDLTQCLRLNPTNQMAYKTRAACYNAKSETKKEIQDWSDGLRISPEDATALALRGRAYCLVKKFAEALADYRKAIRIEPTNNLACNNLAWLHATCPISRFRDGKDAIKMAVKACELTDWKRWDWIDTLAAAYAEAHDFENAVKYEKQAMLFDTISNEDRRAMEQRISLYQRRVPYRESLRLNSYAPNPSTNGAGRK
jgi:tetratricopeptide (TPR) repeat protein